MSFSADRPVTLIETVGAVVAALVAMAIVVVPMMLLCYFLTKDGVDLAREKGASAVDH